MFRLIKGPSTGQKMVLTVIVYTNTVMQVYPDDEPQTEPEFCIPILLTVQKFPFLLIYS